MIIDAEVEDTTSEGGVIVTGVEDEEMTLTCRASGGPPVPRITWAVPATIRYEVIEEDFNVQVTIFKCMGNCFKQSLSLDLCCTLCCSISLSTKLAYLKEY